MKKLFSTLLLSAVLMAGQTLAADEIVFFDAQEAFSHFYKAQLAQSELEERAADVAYECKSMKEDISTIHEKIGVLRNDARDETLSEEVRQSNRDLLEEKLIEMQKLDQEIREYEKLRKEQLEKQKVRMSRELLDEITEVVTAYAKKQGYAAVIERSSQGRNGTQPVYFVANKFDITAELVEILNKGNEVPDGTP